MSASAVVEARNVSYAIRQRLLIANVSLRLEAGRLTVAVGPNGAGKSTLLRVMNGELAASHGQVCYADTDVRFLPPWRLASRRAVMAQSTRLAFDFCVYEVARLGVDSIGRRLPRIERERITGESLARAGISHLAGRSYQSLSGGEQQRVQFARALCQILAGHGADGSQALFLDEPTAHLDMAHQLLLMDDARELAKAGIAIFATLHDLNLAAAYADRLVVLKAGRLVAQGRPEDVLNDKLVAEVFAIDSKAGEVPDTGAPFFLPHSHAARRRGVRDQQAQGKDETG